MVAYHQGINSIKGITNQARTLLYHQLVIYLLYIRCCLSAVFINIMMMVMNNIKLVTRPPVILIISIITVLGISSYLAISLSNNDLKPDQRAVNPDAHFGHSVLSSDAQLGYFPIRNIEHFNFTDRSGDAETQPNSLKISPNNMTPDGNCEHCELIVYTPGQQGWASIAFKSNKPLDLSAAGRIVFFAKGNIGGENVAFVAAGKNVSGSTAISNSSLTSKNAFKNLRFAVTSQNITLSSDWKRYELSLDGRNMTNISYPFGFIVLKGKLIKSISRLSSSDKPISEQVANLKGPLLNDNSPSRVIFFLKGVTIDPYPAFINPLPTIK